MDDAGQPASEVPPQHAGETLRAARDAHGLTLAEIAARTRVPIRHLEALEAGDYASLPSPTYAVGFARAYARAAGANEVEIAQLVRADVDRLGPRAPEYVPYETADPARVPSRGVAIVGFGVALAVLVLVGLFYGTDVFRGGGFTASPEPRIAAAPVAPASVPKAAPTPVAATGGQVRFVATDEVWLRVYDADDKTLYLGTLKPGDHYDVPADANDPMINVGRPDKLQVTLNGAAVPALGTGERAIKDVRVSGAAIAARAAGTPQGANRARVDAASPPSAPRRPSSRRDADARPSRARLTDTQRANLDAARDLAPVTNDSAR